MISNATHDGEKIGLVAGWGKFPIRVAERLVQQGYQVYCVGVYGHADPALRDICTEFREFGMGKMGAQVKYLRSKGVSKATMAGKIFKTLLFQRGFVLKNLPDFAFWKHFYPVFITRSKDKRDDTLLLTVTNLYEDGGICFAPATDFAPELLVKPGLLTNRKINDNLNADIEFGWKMAKQMGQLDSGQSVVVKSQTVMAVEAIEGTDACIRRAGQLCKGGGFTVVKVAKPQQDMRFDVPTVGVGTIETIAEAGGKVLAIEAGKTIILDEAEVIAAANRLKISVIAIDSAALERKISAA